MNELKPLELSLGQTFPPEKLALSLKSMGYVENEYVSRPGDFAQRGYLLDIFPLTFRFPVRISFKLEAVEGIKDFSLLSSKSFTSFPSVRILPMSEIYERKILRQRDEFSGSEPLKNFLEIEPGDFVVHLK